MWTDADIPPEPEQGAPPQEAPSSEPSPEIFFRLGAIDIFIRPGASPSDIYSAIRCLQTYRGTLP